MHNWVFEKISQTKNGKRRNRNGLGTEHTWDAHLYLFYCIVENTGPVEIFDTAARPYTRENPRVNVNVNIDYDPDCRRVPKTITF